VLSSEELLFFEYPASDELLDEEICSAREVLLPLFAKGMHPLFLPFLRSLLFFRGSGTIFNLAIFERSLTYCSTACCTKFADLNLMIYVIK